MLQPGRREVEIWNEARYFSSGRVSVSFGFERKQASVRVDALTPGDYDTIILR